MTINDAIVAGTARLQSSSDTPALDAQVLLAFTLQQNRTWIIAHAKDELPAGPQAEFEVLIEQRATGTPVAYLTGEQEFWSLPLKVTPDTLIPRPETELMVELSLERIPNGAGYRIADIGTGSGAIALAIASERKQCEVVATDISSAALAVAKENANRLGITNMEFREGPDLEPLAGETFDLVVSNPPYIPDTDPHLSQGDVRFEPRGALAAGGDGLDVIRVLVEECRQHLIPGGWLLIEHGYDQEQAVHDLFVEANYLDVDCYRDLSDHPRVTIGRAQAPIQTA